MSQSDRGQWHGRTVLVTGAGGFVASWLCRALVSLEANVVGIVRDSAGERLLRLHGIRDDVTVLHGSIGDYALVERAVNEYEVDTCFHLAAQAIVGAANRSPLSTFESNIKGTWTILEACRATKVQRVIVASSDKAYGVQAQLPYTEDTNLNGRFPYDASKACTDVLAQSYAVTYELPVLISRCANIYGGGDLNWSRLIPGTIRSVLAGEQPIIRSDGTPERDYIHVSDAVAAYLALGEHASNPALRGQGFNFGSGRPVTVLDLVSQILKAAKSGHEPKVLGQASGEIDRQYLDSSRAQKLLGWQAQVGLEAGLADAITWYRAHLQYA